MKTKGKKRVPDRSRLVELLFLLGFTSVLVFLADREGSSHFFEHIEFCESFDEITAGKYPEELDLREVLYFNGQAVPYTLQDSSFYISQDMETEEWVGELKPGDGYVIYFLEDDMWDYKRATIASGHTFSVLVVKGGSYQTAGLVVSGLPILSLTEGRGVQSPQCLSLMDAGAEKSYEGNCSYEIQDADSSGKCGYEIGGIKESMYMPYRDSTWVLVPLRNRLDKVLDKMAGQLWEEIQEYHGAKTYSSGIAYVELILDHEYRGIYGLQKEGKEEQRTSGEIGRDVDSAIDYGLCRQLLAEADKAREQEYFAHDLWETAGVRWKMYRRTIFSEEHLQAMAQECMDGLTFSGALARDASRWPEAENACDVTDVCQFLEQRLTFLDQYYEKR